jgi:hypothetical protein
MSQADAVPPAERADALQPAPLLVGAGRVVDPLLVVDLDGMTGGVPPGVLVPDRILVGTYTRGRPAPELLAALDLTALDLTLCTAGPGAVPATCVAVPDPVAAARQLTAAAAANPQAALVLAQVLRATEGLPVRAALDVESLAYSTLLGGAEFRRWLAGRGPRPAPPPAPRPPVLVERVADRLLITLNRPERRNAYGRELRDALVEALRVAALDAATGGVVIEGAGPSFCAGGDLDEFGTTPDLTTAHFVRTRGGAGVLLHQIAEHAEVHLHGACVGAGIELAAFAGRVTARPDTAVCLPEVGMGLIPGAGGTVSIPRRIGRWRALYLALSGTWLDAASAERWGLVDRVTSWRK